MTVFEKVVTRIIEATEKMGGSLTVSKRRLLDIRQMVAYLEYLLEEFDGDSIDMQIDKTNQVLRLSVTVPDIVCCNDGDRFIQKLVSLADDVKFSRDKSGDLIASFEIVNLWCH